MTKAKRYEELCFSDDFMFCKVLQNNPAVCREMTELILGRKIGSFAEAEPQKTIRLTADGHGVRFDVYFEDDQDTVFDIEMHQWSVQHLAKRTRYYQGMIDLNMLEKGTKYENLKNSYIVFITLDNPYEEIGLHKYRFRNICMEEPCLEMGDGAEKVFLCANGTRDDVSDEIQAFLQYVAGEKPTTEITKKLDQLVLDAREHKEWRLEYMTLLERDERMREEGRAEGREEGRAEEHKNTLREKQRADEAEKRASEAERRADEAEKRAAEAEKRADEAIQRAKEESDQHFRIVEQQMAMMQDQIAALQK